MAKLSLKNSHAPNIPIKIYGLPSLGGLTKQMEKRSPTVYCIWIDLKKIYTNQSCHGLFSFLGSKTALSTNFTSLAAMGGGGGVGNDLKWHKCQFPLKVFPFPP